MQPLVLSSTGGCMSKGLKRVGQANCAVPLYLFPNVTMFQHQTCFNKNKTGHIHLLEEIKFVLRTTGTRSHHSEKASKMSHYKKKILFTSTLSTKQMEKWINPLARAATGTANSVSHCMNQGVKKRKSHMKHAHFHSQPVNHSIIVSAGF